VQEDLYQRQSRLLQEEAKERQHETDIQQFKVQKRPAKRKNQEDIPANKRLRLADGIEKRTFQKAGEDMANPPERERMERERMDRERSSTGISGKEE
jgi:hypothetical protein